MFFPQNLVEIERLLKESLSMKRKAQKSLKKISLA